MSTENKNVVLNDEIKPFPLHAIIGLTSRRSTSDTLRPMAELVAFMTDIDDGVLYTPVGEKQFRERSVACADALIKHPLIQRLTSEYDRFCEVAVKPIVAESHSKAWQAIDNWFVMKTAELPPELRDGFPVGKLQSNQDSYPKRGEFQGTGWPAGRLNPDLN